MSYPFASLGWTSSPAGLVHAGDGPGGHGAPPGGGGQLGLPLLRLHLQLAVLGHLLLQLTNTQSYYDQHTD